MKWLYQHLKSFKNRITNFTSYSLKVIGRLFGVKEIRPNVYDRKQLFTIVFLFIITSPIGMLILGTHFPLVIWLGIILAMSAIVNLDEALMLTATYCDNTTK